MSSATVVRVPTRLWIWAWAVTGAAIGLIWPPFAVSLLGRLPIFPTDLFLLSLPGVPVGSALVIAAIAHLNQRERVAILVSAFGAVVMWVVVGMYLFLQSG